MGASQPAGPLQTSRESLRGNSLASNAVRRIGRSKQAGLQAALLSWSYDAAIIYASAYQRLMIRATSSAFRLQGGSGPVETGKKRTQSRPLLKRSKSQVIVELFLLGLLC